MTLLIAGLALWVLAHVFKRLMPGARAALGERGKAMMAVAILAGIVLMVLGYRGAEFNPVYMPLPGMGHANNTLMLLSVFLFGAGGSKGVVASKLRHPMLLGMIIWAIAHLLVNGDLASIVLFGGLGIWAFVQMMLINYAEGGWHRPAPGPIRKDLINLAGSVVLLAVIAGVHIWLGHSPFLGTYG